MKRKHTTRPQQRNPKSALPPPAKITSSPKPTLYVPMLLLLLLLAINFLTMPQSEYIGDPMVMRFAAERLINAGTLSIPPEIATVTGEKGQFFYHNEKTNKWYSKYPALNSLIYVPPLL